MGWAMAKHDVLVWGPAAKGERTSRGALILLDGWVWTCSCGRSGMGLPSEDAADSAADAHLAAELWSAARIAQEYGWTPAGARTFISRARRYHGLNHVATEGPRDTRLYDPQQVRAAKANMPGRGHYRPKEQR
jgi:hypothetical protein